MTDQNRELAVIEALLENALERLRSLRDADPPQEQQQGMPELPQYIADVKVSTGLRATGEGVVPDARGPQTRS